MRKTLARPSANSGFTILEVLAVVVILGILAAIASPSWVAFTNAREANQLADQVLQRMRQSQTAAGRNRRTQIVEINPNDTDPPQLRYGDELSEEDVRTLEELGEGRLNPGVVAVNAFDANGEEVDAVVFDVNGVIVSDGDLPITVSVTVPATGPGTTRCVVLKTLMGAAEITRGDECQP